MKNFVAVVACVFILGAFSCACALNVTKVFECADCPNSSNYDFYSVVVLEHGVQMLYTVDFKSNWGLTPVMTAQIWGTLQRTNLRTFESDSVMFTPNITITKDSRLVMSMSPPVFFNGLIYVFWGYGLQTDVNASIQVTLMMGSSLKPLTTINTGGSLMRHYYSTHQKTGLAFFGVPQGSFTPPGSVTPMWAFDLNSLEWQGDALQVPGTLWYPYPLASSLYPTPDGNAVLLAYSDAGTRPNILSVYSMPDWKPIHTVTFAAGVNIIGHDVLWPSNVAVAAAMSYNLNGTYETSLAVIDTSSWSVRSGPLDLWADFMPVGVALVSPTQALVAIWSESLGNTEVLQVDISGAQPVISARLTTPYNLFWIVAGRGANGVSTRSAYSAGLHVPTFCNLVQLTI